MSVQMHITGLKEAAQAVSALGRLQKHRALSALGNEVETQTKRRIQVEKTDPGGKAWQPWSAKHRAKSAPGASILQQRGDLLNSIGFSVSARAVFVGTNSVYAATHQFGDKSRNIPARAFLGVSDKNEVEVLEVLNDFIGNHIKRVFA